MVPKRKEGKTSLEILSIVSIDGQYDIEAMPCSWPYVVDGTDDERLTLLTSNSGADDRCHKLPL